MSKKGSKYARKMIFEGLKEKYGVYSKRQKVKNCKIKKIGKKSHFAIFDPQIFFFPKKWPKQNS